MDVNSLQLGAFFGYFIVEDKGRLAKPIRINPDADNLAVSTSGECLAVARLDQMLN